MALQLPKLDPYLLAKRALDAPLGLCLPARVEGMGNVPATGPVVLAPNHRSLVDSIVLAQVVPRRITFIAKAEHFDDWRSGWAMRLTGQIRLERRARQRGGAGTCSGGGRAEERGCRRHLPRGDTISRWPAAQGQ